MYGTRNFLWTINFNDTVSGEFWRYKNYRSIYCTVYLDRSCLHWSVYLQVYDTRARLMSFVVNFFLIGMIWQHSRTFIHEEHGGSFKIILDTEKRTEKCKK
jgi:hypothetical protein